MKKSLKWFFGVLLLVFVVLIADFLLLFVMDRPLIARKQDNVYKALWYDAYLCPEFSSPKIKMKWTKYNCAQSSERLEVKEIIDKTKTMPDFACAEALESFYEDEDSIYYYSCIKSKYVVVVYENGYEETVEDALKYGSIKISDLDEFAIAYYKYPKKETE